MNDLDYSYPNKALILLASYGESAELGLLPTPIKIPRDMVVELAPRISLLKSVPTPGLLSADNEFNEIIVAFNKKYPSPTLSKLGVK